MTQRATVYTIIAATWVLSACGVKSPDAVVDRATQDGPRLFVELQSLPDGHPPVPGFSSPPALPEGHPPVPGFHSTPTLPEGHPRCPARESLETPPSDAGIDQALQDPPELIST
jgi:hypothetical protein